MSERPAKILVVDDDPSARDIVLKEFGSAEKTEREAEDKAAPLLTPAPADRRRNSKSHPSA